MSQPIKPEDIPGCMQLFFDELCDGDGNLINSMLEKGDV